MVNLSLYTAKLSPGGMVSALFAVPPEFFAVAVGLATRGSDLVMTNVPPGMLDPVAVKRRGSLGLSVPVIVAATIAVPPGTFVVITNVPAVGLVTGLPLGPSEMKASGAVVPRVVVSGAMAVFSLGSRGMNALVAVDSVSAGLGSRGMNASEVVDPAVIVVVGLRGTKASGLVVAVTPPSSDVWVVDGVITTTSLVIGVDALSAEGSEVARM